MARGFAPFASPLQLVAVLAFFLPFYSVSCQGRPLATASGYEVATRGFHADNAAERALPNASEPEQRGSAAWLLLFPVLAAGAAVCSVAAGRAASEPGRTKARTASSALGTLGVVVLVSHYVMLRGELARLVAQGLGEQGGDGPGAEMGRHMAATMLQGVSLDLQAGWYVGLAALLAGTALAAAPLLAPKAEPAQPELPQG